MRTTVLSMCSASSSTPRCPTSRQVQTQSTMASSSGLLQPAGSSSGHKRKQPGDDYCCVVCMEVLLDPVTLPCGHSLDKACLEQVIATAPLVRGRRAPCCPTCRGKVPMKPSPCVSVTIRNIVEERFPEEVRPRPAIQPHRLQDGPLRAVLCEARRASIALDGQSGNVGFERWG
jgi:hypothetical protein